MLRILVTLVIGGLLGGVAGFAVGVFAYPYIFLADIVAEERLAGAESKPVIATGMFVHANPSDPVHYGKGRVTVFADALRLEPDFEVGPGPKYHVYLVPMAEVTPSSPVADTMFVDLGRLRAFRGSQVFSIPKGVDLGAYKSVVIWCERFGVLISPAKLELRAG